jgi:hypothetical protein
MNDNILDEMDLPLANPNEELENISRNKFSPLFDVTLFELRPEKPRDKGIDLEVEAKKNGRYTNFKFNVQLKATDSKDPNIDGSISHQINTYNINYLFNGSSTAYYVLYDKKTDQFFFENLGAFVKAISEKNPLWKKQATHVLRFSKKLDANAIAEMYKLAIQKGEFHRKINEKLVAKSAILESGNRIHIDYDLNVFDDQEIRETIEAIGLDLVNEGQWTKIITVHKRASGSMATTAKYNLILGIANYYSANYLDALSFLRKASKNTEDLSKDLIEHGKYFQIVTEFTLGMISHDEYKQKIEPLESTDNVGLYVKIEKAKNKYTTSLLSDPANGYDSFSKELNQIINDSNANTNIKLLARCELMYYEGIKNNMEFVRGVANINAMEASAGFNQDLRMLSAVPLIKCHNNWEQKSQALLDDAFEAKNHFTYYMAVVASVKVKYQFTVYTDILIKEQERVGLEVVEKADQTSSLENMITILDLAENFYQHFEHVGNICATLSNKYQILHFMGRFDAAYVVLEEITSIVEKYDLNEEGRKLLSLKESGTTHERFHALIDGSFRESNDQLNEHNYLTKEMEKMDDAEVGSKISSKEVSLIQLMPIGMFQYPTASRDHVYAILGIVDEKVKVQFNNIYNLGAVPVANIYYNPITNEGPLDGHLVFKNIENWRHVYRIRKALYEARYYRFEQN